MSIFVKKSVKKSFSYQIDVTHEMLLGQFDFGFNFPCLAACLSQELLICDICPFGPPAF